MLARGELRAVGATTLDEYRKHIEKDAALERRFQPVLVGEPSVEDAIAILRGLKERYEVHHGVRIQDSALIAAATPQRPLHRRPLPARQGHRPHRRGRLQAAHRDRLAADRDRRGRSPRPAARDRAHLAGQRDRRRERRAPRGDRARARRPARAQLGHEGRVAGREGRDPQGPGRQGAPRAGPPRARARRARGRPRARRAAAPRRDPRARAPARRRPSRSSPARRASSRRRSTPRTSPRSSRRWTGIPVSRLLEGEVAKLVHMEERLHQRVIGQDEAVAVGLQRPAPLARRAQRPRSPDRQLPLPRPDRRRQDRAGARAGRVHVRLAGRDGPHRHVGVHGEARRQPPRRRAARLRRLRRGRPADRGRAPPAVLGAPARRDREGPPRRLQRAAAGDGRRAADRRPGPDGRLPPRRAHHDLEHPGRPGRGRGALQARVHQPPGRHRRVPQPRPRADRRRSSTSRSSV